MYIYVCVYTMSHLYNEKTIWARRWEQQLVIPRSDRDPISQNMEVNSPWSSPQSTPDQEEETPKKKAQNVPEMTEMTCSFHVEIRGGLILYIYIYTYIYIHTYKYIIFYLLLIEFLRFPRLISTQAMPFDWLPESISQRRTLRMSHLSMEWVKRQS